MNVDVKGEEMLNTLRTLIGQCLGVTHRREKSQHVFDFYSIDGDVKQSVKTVFGYKGAKLFAEGIRLGKATIIAQF